MPRSTTKHDFSLAPQVRIPRSSFDRSHGNKFTFEASQLVPMYVDEALPGDTFNMNLTCFGRMVTPKVPVMDNIFLDTFFFAVPYRLVWNNFEKFMGAQDNPGDSTDFLVPQMTFTVGVVAGSLSDYLGIPLFWTGFSANSLHHRAYNLIWNEWFRDQNIQNSVVVDLDDGPDDPADYVLLRRNKRFDYFTSSLPWPQKGAAVTLPLGTSAPVLGIGKTDQNYGSTSTLVYESDGTTTTYPFSSGIDSGSPGQVYHVEGTAATLGYPNIYADLSLATAATINQIRQAFQLQKMLERDARGGTRYVEKIYSHFGVISKDSRLNRPEYLGGGSMSINIHQVEQTSSTDATTPQGNLAAYAKFSGSGHGFTKSFTEHCLLIGLVNVRADLTYQQGLDRMFSRQTVYDYFWPALAHIGEQSVLRKELYVFTSGNEDVFGYQERYAEYRYKPSRLAGKFRSDSFTGLDIWHLAQYFGSPPTLNDNFIREDVPIDRVVTTPSDPDFYFDGYFNLICARPIPVHGTPGKMDRF